MLDQNNGTAFDPTKLGLLCCLEAWDSQKRRDIHSFFLQELLFFHSEGHPAGISLDVRGDLPSLNRVSLPCSSASRCASVGCLEKEGTYQEKETTNAETLRKVMLKKKRKSRVWECRTP